MFALIEGTRVAQVESETFPVAPPLKWIECPDHVIPEWTYSDGKFSPQPPRPTTPNPEPTLIDLRAQLDSLAAKIAALK